jgi:hypothetical protein
MPPPFRLLPPSARRSPPFPLAPLHTHLVAAEAGAPLPQHPGSVAHALCIEVAHAHRLGQPLRHTGGQSLQVGVIAEGVEGKPGPGTQWSTQQNRWKGSGGWGEAGHDTWPEHPHKKPCRQRLLGMSKDWAA